MTDAAYGQASVVADTTDYNVVALQINSALAKIQTLSIVEVQSCTNSGGVSPAGTVVVKVLVNLMTGNGQAVQHGDIYSVPYLRAQGGDFAIILDPQEGDLGLCGFCSRDSSAVLASKGQANPGSNRRFDWADAVYIGGMANGAPTAYIQFDSSGIKILSPVLVTVQGENVAVTATATVTVTAPEIVLDGDVTIGGTVTQTGGGAGTFSGSLAVTGVLTGGTVKQGTVELGTHTHSGVTTGGGDTGPPT
jgi:hypothetical protein